MTAEKEDKETDVKKIKKEGKKAEGEHGRGRWQQLGLFSPWQTRFILEGHSVSGCHTALTPDYENVKMS